MPTARMPPSTGPARYGQKWAKSPRIRSGPNERAGFIDAPVSGLGPKSGERDVAADRNRRERADVLRARGCAEDRRDEPTVSTPSTRAAFQSATCAPGSVAPIPAAPPMTLSTKRHARTAPASCTTT